jgi:cytochrome c553
MRRSLSAAAVLTFVAGLAPFGLVQIYLAGAAQAENGPPPWAYGFATPLPNPPPPQAPPNPAAQFSDTSQQTLPGTDRTFTRAQISNRYGPADWYPGDHPPMPDIVAYGRESATPKIYACSLCHYPNGKGRPENANVTGLTYEYIVQQLTDFRNGARVTSDPRKPNTQLMMWFAQQMTGDEIKAAAAYFAAIPASPWIKVVESDAVPKTKPIGGVFLPLTGEDAGTEPLGDRIIETPVSVEETEVRRNPRSGFIAYAPPGSVKKGEELVMTGGGKVTACTVCHGADLKGLGPVPTLAGRSPSYIGRQLYDMQHGNRAGLWTPLMAPVVSKLSEEDILNAAAYLASLTP